MIAGKYKIIISLDEHEKAIDWLDNIKDDKFKKLVLDRAKEQDTKDSELASQCNALSTAFTDLFDWDETPEEHRFWNNIYKQIIKIEQNGNPDTISFDYPEIKEEECTMPVVAAPIAFTIASIHDINCSFTFKEKDNSRICFGFKNDGFLHIEIDNNGSNKFAIKEEWIDDLICWLVRERKNCAKPITPIEEENK